MSRSEAAICSAIEPLPPFAFRSAEQSIAANTELGLRCGTMLRGPSHNRQLTCATNDAGVASVTLEVVTIPVPKPAAAASSMMVTASWSLPAVVAMRPALVTMPVAIDVAVFAESGTYSGRRGSSSATV